MKSVVFIVNSLQNGGAERVVVSQANYIAKQGKHKPIIICFRKWNQYEIDKRVKMIYLTDKKNFSIFEKLILVKKMRKQLDSEISKINTDNIALMTTHLPLPHIVCRKSRYNKKMLFVMHNPHFQFKLSGSYLFKKMMQLMYYGKNLVCVSNGIKNELKQVYGMRDDDLSVIYNPLDFERIDMQLGVKCNTSDLYKNYILFCGRLTRQKRPDRAVKWFCNSDLRNSYKLVMIGVGEDENKVRKQIKKNKAEKNILLLGWQENAYIWMKNAKVLLCTSDYESFGMVVAEALYCGCPVVSTNCKYGPDEILTGNLSKYLTELNTDSIDKAVKKALANYPAINKNIFNKFKIQTIVNEYFSVYRSKCI